MGTFLFDSVVFGPVKSRRLGVSLGINLLPNDNKLCNFNCIYCECGWNRKGARVRFNSRESVRTELEKVLAAMKGSDEAPDVITFAGNGEPTLHPDFEAIIEDTRLLRDRYFPEAKIAVLTNGTLIDRDSVRRALLRVDENIVKLDSALDRTVRLIDDPNNPGYRVEDIVRAMRSFEGKMTLQTMFVRGTHNGKTVDNTSPEEVAAWLEAIERIHPGKVMIYTIDRDTPGEGLEKVPEKTLEEIAGKVREKGFVCTVSA